MDISDDDLPFNSLTNLGSQQRRGGFIRRKKS